MLEPIVILKNPLKGIRKLVENIWTTAKPEGYVKVNVVAGFPVHTQEVPVIRVNRDKAEGRLKVSLCHVGTRAQGLENRNGNQIIWH